MTHPLMRAATIGLTLIVMPIAAMAQGQALTPPAELPASTYTTDPAHTSLTWRVSHMGLSNYTARFSNVNATLVLDPANPAAAKLEATVDSLSIKTDYPNAKEKDFDKELAEGKDWFNGKQFPSIRFVSEKVVPTGATTADIIGQLTFLGVTKPLTLKATYNGGYAQKPFAPEGVAGIGFSATGTLKRSEWGMAAYIPMIGDEVQLQIETELHSAPQIKKPN